MKILLIGASGRTGQEVLAQAIERGHDVVALVRDPAKVAMKSPRLTLVQGSPENPADVARAIAGTSAVIATLNNARASDMPWAKPISPPDLMANSIRNAVAAMRELGLRRIVVLSAAGAGDSFAESAGIMRWMIRNTNLRQVYADHDAVDAYLHAQSDIDWTIVRAAALTNADAVKPERVLSYANQPKPAGAISRKHVAMVLLDALNDPGLIGKAPTVSER